VIWVWSTLLTLHQAAKRRRRIAAAIEELEHLRKRLAGAKTRLRGAAEIDFQTKAILDKYHVNRYLKVSRTVREEDVYKQTRRGRPRPNTAYRKVTKRRFDIQWSVDEEAIAYDHKSDGVYPLMTNDRGLLPAEVLEVHKRQPVIEKRFEQTKTVHEIAPALLKNEGRIEALFTVYFLGLLVQALIERELRLGMKHNNIEELPLYPEQRQCARPTTEQVLRMFSLAVRNKLVRNGEAVQVFDCEFTALQKQTLALLGVPDRLYLSSKN
jgi:transposase